jgi:hypothetical protein
MAINQVLTHSLSSHKGNKLKRMLSSNLPLYSSSFTTTHNNDVLSQNTLETASKTFLVKLYREENPTKRINKIDQIFRSGRMKDLHENNFNDYYSLNNDSRMFKNRLNNLKKENMKDKIEKLSKEMSNDFSRKVYRNKRPFSNEENHPERELTCFLSTSPTNYNRGLIIFTKRKNDKEKPGHNKFKSATDKFNEELNGYKNQNLFLKPKWKEIPKLQIQGYSNNNNNNNNNIQTTKNK